jgi:hypothetical protein
MQGIAGLLAKLIKTFVYNAIALTVVGAALLGLFLVYAVVVEGSK